MVIGLLLIFAGIIVGPLIFVSYQTKLLQQDVLNQFPVLQQLLPYEPSIIASPLLKLPTNSTILTIALSAYTIYRILAKLFEKAKNMFKSCKKRNRKQSVVKESTLETASST
uniref:Uncharacterized protein n=1 Tax=Ditylenchus dipsaci TaxID=166011 RepID=A0A915ETI1_9BILA